MKLSVFFSLISLITSFTVIAMEKEISTEQNILNEQLLIAAESTDYNNLFIVSDLIKKGAQVNCFDSNGQTPLHKVAQSKHLSHYAVAQCILTYKPNITIKDNEGNTPLHLAAKNDNQMIAHELILNGADPRIKNNNNEPASQLIDIMNFKIQLETLIMNYPHEAKQMHSPNVIFVAFNYYQDRLPKSSIRLIFKESFSYIDQYFNRTIWQKESFTPLITNLLMIGAHPDILLPKGTTALHLATKLASLELFTLTLKYSRNINVYDRDNKTPLHFATNPDQIDKAKLLLEKDADINVVDKNGNTPVHKIIKTLIALKNTNCDKEKEAQKKVLDLFLEYRPELTIKNNDGKTALDLLAETQYTGFFSSFYNLISKNHNTELIQKLKSIEENKNMR